MNSFKKTRTGAFPLGLRLPGPAWGGSLAAAARWMSEHGLGVVDIGSGQIAEVPALLAAGLQIGTCDLFGWGGYQGMLSADPDRRAAAVAEASARIEEGAAVGVGRFFTLLLAEDEALPRAETLRHLLDSYARLIPVLERCDARLCIEGWPGCNAHGCNPESLRAIFAALPSARLGINYDPSHLLRMGIDPLRFLREFAPRVGHVHGKDTLIDAGLLYEIGHEQAGFTRPTPAHGGHVWRYVVPGKGGADWGAIFELLVACGYAGAVCIELEDADYHGELASEQQGILFARDALGAY
jgi:sugar phosphate isomerase/epimerase